MKKVIIIGAGVSGLSAGIFAREHGFDVEILEVNNYPGGMCTGSVKENYYFDNCINYIKGTNKESNMYKVWQHLGVFKNTDIIYSEYLNGYTVSGDKFLIYKDINKLIKNMFRISPEDKVEIEEFYFILNKFIKYDRAINKPKNLCNFVDYYLHFKNKYKVQKYIRKLKRISLEEFLCNFRSSIIRKSFLDCLPRGNSAVDLFYLLADYIKGNMGHVDGGGLRISLKLEKRFKDIGGKIRYNHKVEEIIVKNKKAQGVKLNWGNVLKADYIISAVDSTILLNKLLKKKYNNVINYQYNQSIRHPRYSAIGIKIGVMCDLSNYYRTMIYDVEPFEINKTIIDQLTISIEDENNIYISEKNKSIIKLNIIGDFYDYFKELKENSMDAYNNEITRIMELVVSRIINIYPKIRGNIQCYNIASPINYNKRFYCDRDIYKTISKNSKLKLVYKKGKINNINNLYLAGQWFSMPEGIHKAAIYGKWSVQRLCDDCNVKFKYKF